MAQPTNPVITHSGYSTYWLSSSYYSNNNIFLLRQNWLILKLLPFFFIWGTDYLLSLYINKYWNRSPHLLNKNYLFKNYRYYKVSILYASSLKKKLIRSSLHFYLYSRIWILRYQGWILICWFLFKNLENKISLNYYYKTILSNFNLKLILEKNISYFFRICYLFYYTYLV